MLTQFNRWIGGGAVEEQKLREISLEYKEAELVSATSSFDPSRRLGSGNYGCVYRGTLKDGHEVAIKVIEVDEDDTSGFADEVLVLSKFRHPNLVTLMGWGSGLDEDGCGRRYLVYELLEGGDVAGRLAKARGKNGVVTPFGWSERLWVALDAACGLSHMHNSTPKAFHRDIKSANILLDRSGTAKMADFGLSGIAKNKNKLNMTCEQISGTPGYACPHYIKTGKVTEATEVYAYGMVVMEMLLNTMPACMGQNGTIVYPIFQIVMPQADGALQRAVSSADAKAQWPNAVARDVAELSLVCSSQEESQRNLSLPPGEKNRGVSTIDRFPRKSEKSQSDLAAMSSLLHYYRVADLHVNPALQKKASDAGFTMLSSEVCYNIQATAPLDAEETKKLEYLLRETFEPEKFGTKSFLSGQVVEVAPRQQFTSAWSTNAVSICHSIALQKIVRIEKSRRYQVEAKGASLTQFAKLVHDRMTECEYPKGITTFEEHQEPEAWTKVPVMAQGAKALEDLSKQKGLGYDEQDIAYYLRVFKDELKRDPTTVECFDLAQGNSEHSRHWFFGGKVVIDGEDMPLTLFQWVKRPLKERISNSVIGFHDNSSALRGYSHTAFLPLGSTVAQPTAFKEVTKDFDITLTVETHNFPCGIAPFPGAETGAGGRIRDGESTGKGSLVVAAVAGYATGNLHIPGYKMPWEFDDFKYPSNMAPPLQVLIDCSNGASDYGNKFGEPLICGWTRSCGMRMPSGERFEWVKPIMLSGGLGQMDHGHLVKEEPKAGQLVVKIGGPAYRIGVGGGAASSMVAGDNQEELDFNAVQRGDAEMQQKVNRVVRACVELGEKNPILSIHDQGAGGSGNVLKEISEPAGAVIDLRKMHVGDPSMSFLELWTAEFQENNALLLGKEDEALFDQICKREKVPYAVLGTITGDGKVVVKDSRDGSTPVDLPLDKVLGKMPQKVFPMQRIYKQTPKALELPASLKVQMALETGVLRLLSVCSKRFLTNKVDRSVTGQIAQQQCVGPLQTPLADFACIAQSPLSVSGGATAIGEQPLKGLPGDPESCVSMARLAVAEALTNLAWIRIPTLDSIKASGNWMWAAKLPGEGPKMYDIAEALSHIMVELGLAIDGGKDSLSMAARVPLGNGQVETAKSPGQFVLTVYAPVPDVRIKATPDLKTRGDGVLLFVDLGEGPPVLGGSALSQVFGQLGFGRSPKVDSKALKAAFTATQRLLSGGLICAGHDRSDGGLLTAVLEMAFAGRVGIDMKLDDASPGSIMEKLFNEAPGLIYEVRRSDLAAVLRVFEAEGVTALEIGATRKDLRAVVHVGSECVLDADVASLHCIWEATSFQLERQQCDVVCVEQEESGFKNRRVPPWKLSYTPEPTADGVLSSGRKHRVAIVRQEGSNGDREMAAAFHMAGFEAWDVHMTDLLEGRTSLESFRGAAFVGGFSYADTLDSAKGWAGSVLFSPKLEAQFKAFRDRADSFALGICNGCQLLALLGWAPGASSGGVLPMEQQPRFVHNRSGRFESRFATVRIDACAASKVWLKGMEGTQMGVWVNHGEGRCHFPDASVFERVKKEQLIPMRYIDDEGNATETYPFNPNGSPEGIVGLCSADGRILSIMPHPERLASWPWQWPYAPQEWMEGPKRLRCSPWLKMFQNVRDWCDGK